MFETAWSGSVDSLAESLKAFVPKDAKGQSIPFKEFDWYERKDIQSARQRGAAERATAIDARMLLHAVLTEESGNTAGVEAETWRRGVREAVRAGGGACRG
jgi:hypothetical protein